MNEIHSKMSCIGAPEEKLEVSSMWEQHQPEHQQLVDQASGGVEIWRIEDDSMVPVEKNQYGQFFSGDCYVILYTHLVYGKENYIVYYWLGQVSTT